MAGGTRDRLVVLVSGAGTNLQALLDAQAHPDYPAEVVAVGSDRAGARGLERATVLGIPTFVVATGGFADRAEWDETLAAAIGEFDPDWIVSAGFMRLLGPAVLETYPQRVVNTHPALLPAFPGVRAVAEALSYGVKITGCTVHFVDAGIDTGPVIAQQAVSVTDEDDEDSLHERIKTAERQLLVEVVARLATSDLRVEGRRVR